MAKRYAINKTKFLSDDELRELTLILEKTKEKFPRDVTLIYTLLKTGARAQEALNLTVGDLNDQHEAVYIQGLKDSDDREIPVPSWLYKMMKKQCEGKKSEDKIFNISYSRLRQIWDLYTPSKEKSLHSTRHTFAITIFKSKRDLRLVQVALGHRNIQNTMVYANYVYSTEELRRLLVA